MENEETWTELLTVKDVLKLLAGLLTFVRISRNALKKIYILSFLLHSLKKELKSTIEFSVGNGGHSTQTKWAKSGKIVQ